MRKALDAFNENISQAGDGTDPDFQFHLQIAIATGNRHFSDILTHFGTGIIPRTRVNSAGLANEDPQTYLNRVHLEHEAIYVAIARQDPESASAAMYLHLANSRLRMRLA
ncbi:HTH-type transcriptional regulator LutR [compost metagenome]